MSLLDWKVELLLCEQLWALGALRFGVMFKSWYPYINIASQGPRCRESLSRSISCTAHYRQARPGPLRVIIFHWLSQTPDASDNFVSDVETVDLQLESPTPSGPTLGIGAEAPEPMLGGTPSSWSRTDRAPIKNSISAEISSCGRHKLFTSIFQHLLQLFQIKTH